MPFRITMRIFLCTICIFSVVSVTHAEQPSNKIHLDAELALTGDVAPQNNAFLEGIQLGLKGINDKGGIHSRTIELSVEDSQLLSKNSNTAARKLLATDKVDGVILGSVVEAMAAGPAFERAKIPALVLWDASKEIDDVGEYVFSIGLWSEASGWVAADYALSQGQSAAILAGLEPWSETLAEGFKEKFKKSGGEVVAERKIDISTTDFRTEIALIRAKHPQILYVPFCYNLISLFRQLKEANLDKISIVTSDCIADAHLHEAPGIFEGVVETAAPNLNSPAYQQMIAEYVALKRSEPTYPFLVALGYDAVRLLAKAWETVGTEGSQVKNWLYKMPTFVGAAGNILFNEKGSSWKKPGLFRVSKNRLQSLN
jgi:ABC-type branched-subunit amino acid transport system substrate-binding protein